MNAPKTKVFLCITKSNWGGAQKYVYDLATNLPRERYAVSVLLGGDGELARRLEEAGIETIRLQKSGRDIEAGRDIGLFLELLRIFRREKPDIVHLNSSKLGGTGALAARLARVKKIIFTAHGWAFNEERPDWQKFVIKGLSCLTVLLAHRTIAVSEATKNQLPKFFRKKVVVVRNGLRKGELRSREEARAAIAEKIGAVPPDVVWIGTISELHSNKGLAYTIEAVSGLAENAVFVIAGEGEERPRLEALIREKDLGRKVYLVGRLEEAGSYLRAFDIFTLTSITEALPYALIEAGHAGVPVVASRVGGIPEIVEDGKTGILVNARRPKEIRNALEMLIGSPKKAAAFGKAAEAKIAKEFSFEKMLAETYRLYEH